MVFPAWLKKFTNGILGVSMEDPDKIAAAVHSLDEESWKKNGKPIVNGKMPNVWQPIDGYMALTGFKFEKGASFFNPTSGYPIKGFVNQQTGEVRTFAASLFEKNE